MGYVAVRLSEREPTNISYYERTDRPLYSGWREPPYALTLLKDDVVIDVRIVRTLSTLQKIINTHFYKKNLDILIYPQPIRPSLGFFEEYKQAKTNVARINLFKKYNILSENNILFINKLIIDVDSPFDDVLDVFNKLKIDYEAVDIIKTKRKRFRCTIHLRPTPAKYISKAKEIMQILSDYFNKHNLNFDGSFKNIQHPVWLAKHKRDEEREEEVYNQASGVIGFFDLYRLVKNIQKQHKLYSKKEKVRKVKKIRKQKRCLADTPIFMQRGGDYITKLEKAVQTLYYSRRGGIYLHFIQPVAGWVKYLGLGESFYWELMNRYVQGRDKDIQKGWRYARELRFNYTQIEEIYDLKEYAKNVIDYLKIVGQASRQELLRKVFNNYKWLEKKVMDYLVSKNRVSYRFEKSQKKGRPKKIYFLKRKIKISKLNHEDMLIAIFNKSEKPYFSHIIPSFRGVRGDPLNSGSGGGWYLSKYLFVFRLFSINEVKELLNRYVDGILYLVFKHGRGFSFYVRYFIRKLESKKVMLKVRVKSREVVHYGFYKKVSANLYLVRKNLDTFQRLGYFFRKDALNFYQLKARCLPISRSPPIFVGYDSFLDLLPASL